MDKVEFNFCALGQRGDYDVAPISRTGGTRKLGDLLRCLNNSLGKKKARGQLFVGAGRPHRGGDSLAADPNLKGFFDGKIVMQVFQNTILFSANDLIWLDSVFFHGIGGDVIMTPVEICHIYISRGHNFVGHHGLEPDEFPMTEVATVECVAGRGLHGDRYFDFKENYKGQITFFSLEVFDELCGALQLEGIVPSAVRRNVFTRSVDLNEFIGRKFEVQDIHFYGTEESRPCDWMNRAIAPGAKEFLKGRGGLRARILTDGTLHSTAKIPEQVG